MGMRFILIFGLIFFSEGTLDAMDQKIFYELHRQPISQWMVDQIHDDLTPFENELSCKSLDDIFAKEGGCLVRVQIAQGQISIQKSEDSLFHPIPDKVISHLYALNALIPLPDMDFIFTGHDTLSEQMSGPILVISKQKKTKGILFPDWYALEGFEPIKSQVVVGNRTYPWEKKTDLLYFRDPGSGVFDIGKLYESPRAKLVMLSLQNFNHINARFSLSEHPQDCSGVAASERLIGDYSSIKNQTYYRYLMDIDGDCAATPHFPLLLFSNSTVFKHSTNSVLWFYGAIKPFIHFIPVAEDLSDIFDQLAWARNHNQECRKISENARSFAERILTKESAYLYLYQLIKAYSIKQKVQYQL